MKPHFIVIDDDKINNIICQKMVQFTFPGSVVETFTDPEMGLAHILSMYTAGEGHNAVLFLDINMPSFSGWEVLEKLTESATLIKDHLRIFMLSSSVDPDDKEKACSNPLVTDYITKSLSNVKLRELFPDLSADG